MSVDNATPSATLDTNIFPNKHLLARCSLSKWRVAVVSVTKREATGTDYFIELMTLQTLAEIGVWDESTWDDAEWADKVDHERLEKILSIVSNNSFPSARALLSESQRRQQRDAMILEAHCRSGNSFFVTNDLRGFVKHGRGTQLETLLNTRIVTGEQFTTLVDCPEQVPLGDCLRIMRWAESVSSITKLYLFGSRVRGTGSADSDLDIAIEIRTPDAGEIPFATWLHEEASWKFELQARVNLRIDLQWRDVNGSTKTIDYGIGEGAVELFSRDGSRDEGDLSQAKS